ncbi:MAG TPA: hypothetical protein VFY06_03085, partial [Verrucomicrobiae bacterium]|nr:hypothetical protein [Verrucomicrobiae bacterium]
MNDNTITISNRLPPESINVLIVLGSVLGVTLIVFFCVLVFREKRKHRHKHHRHRHHRRHNYREQLQQTGSGIKELIQKR